MTRNEFTITAGTEAFNSLNIAERTEVGFNFNGKLYKLIITDVNEIADGLKVTTDSKTGEPEIRFRPNQWFKAKRVGNGKAILIDNKPMKASRYDNTPNAGWAFERFTYERLGRQWKGMDNIPMWEGADITIAGHLVALKFEDCEIIKLSTINNAIEEGRL